MDSCFGTYHQYMLEAIVEGADLEVGQASLRKLRGRRENRGQDSQAEQRRKKTWPQETWAEQRLEPTQGPEQRLETTQGKIQRVTLVTMVVMVMTMTMMVMMLWRRR